MSSHIRYLRILADIKVAKFSPRLRKAQKCLWQYLSDQHSDRAQRCVLRVAHDTKFNRSSILASLIKAQLARPMAEAQARAGVVQQWQVGSRVTLQTTFDEVGISHNQLPPSC